MVLIDRAESVLLVIDAPPGVYWDRPDADGGALATFVHRVACVAVVQQLKDEPSGLANPPGFDL